MANAIFRFAVPSGSLQKKTLWILRAGGFNLPRTVGRDDFIGIANNIEFYLRDRANIASLVAAGTFDAGITGSDLRIEEGDKAKNTNILCNLNYSRASNNVIRYVLAVPQSYTLKDWGNKKERKIGAERLNLARKCLGGIFREDDRFVRLPGKEESAIADGLCDAVFVPTETGTSLKAYALEILFDNLFVSTPVLICRKGLEKEQEKFMLAEQIGLSMQSVLNANGKVLVTFNFPADRVNNLMSLPAGKSPTINRTMSDEWIAAQILIEDSKRPEVLYKLKSMGAQNILVQNILGMIS